MYRLLLFFIYEADILNAAPGNYKSIIAHNYITVLMYSLPCSYKDKSSHFTWGQEFDKDRSAFQFKWS